MTDAYQPIPVSEASRLARGYAKAQIIILAWDSEHELIHATTYGQNADHKIYAAALSEQFVEFLGCDPKRREYFEDFRDPRSAVFARSVADAQRPLRSTVSDVLSDLDTFLHSEDMDFEEWAGNELPKLADRLRKALKVSG